MTVVFDDGAQVWVAVEGGAADALLRAAMAVKVTVWPLWSSWVQARSTRPSVLAWVILFEPW
ncbi:hypothetical protein [Saccharopolyspora hattusasensis]|uniref:hypothetical protein n=1 Tax=Saccharopolyspora hattusasensis TaxID=1128679 RepID=UPI003D96F8ED